MHPLACCSPTRALSCSAFLSLCPSLSPYLSVSWPQVKGRATAHTQIVENALEGTTVGIQAADPEDFEPDAIAAKLTKALGSPVTL